MPAVIEVDESDTEPSLLRGPDVDAGTVAAEHPAAILFTSGTTSAPTGVVITEANYTFALSWRPRSDSGVGSPSTPGSLSSLEPP